MRSLILVLMMAIGACTPMVVDQPREALAIQPTAAPAQLSQQQAIENFNIAVARIEPVAEQMCRQHNPRQNCDFQIVVDNRPNQPVNAYQTIDRGGRPIIAFTVPLIADARNRDEIAFVMAHEAAHHIEGHIARQQTNAVVGAALIGGLAGVFGATDQSTIDAATRLGASVGARSYSKDFELEADALGTRISAAAGFDPLKGAQFFFRIPDPGDRFLGTHPANADRLRTVQRVASGL
jgi:Zn-dependent protease with chaperone function